MQLAAALPRFRALPLWPVLLLALVVAAAPAGAQGRGNGGTSPAGKSHGKPPSRTELPSAATIAAPAGAVPFAWIDDATLLGAGTLWVGISAMRWQGNGIGETDAPIVDAAIGFTPRVQLGASIPHVVGSGDPTGAAGGIGTSYVNTKLALVQHSPVRIAATPTLQILGPAAVTTSSDSRMRWGLPADVEFDVTRSARAYVGTGYFSTGVWFAGGGLSTRASDRVGVSFSMSTAWTATSTVAPGGARRNEITGGASYSVAAPVAIFGAFARTFATSDDNGAGTTVTGGLSFTLARTRGTP